MILYCPDPCNWERVPATVFQPKTLIYLRLLEGLAPWHRFSHPEGDQAMTHTKQSDPGHSIGVNPWAPWAGLCCPWLSLPPPRAWAWASLWLPGLPGPAWPPWASLGLGLPGPACASASLGLPGLLSRASAAAPVSFQSSMGQPGRQSV